jgi:hypothetical protein
MLEFFVTIVILYMLGSYVISQNCSGLINNKSVAKRINIIKYNIIVHIP